MTQEKEKKIRPSQEASLHENMADICSDFVSRISQTTSKEIEKKKFTP